MKNKIFASFSRTFNKLSLKAVKHSPEILVVAGTVGIIASGIMACRATLKVNDILNEAKEDIETIHTCAEDETLIDEYTQEDVKKDLTITYFKTGMKLVKLYAPSVVLAAVSITSIAASNHILRKRNLALVAAYETVDKGFKNYRSRVIERFGEEVDKELKYNIKAKKFEEVTKDKDGNEIKSEKTVHVADPLDSYSVYARFFDSSCRDWEDRPEHNLMFLSSEQDYANDLLRARGYVFLNDIYDRLDFPRTKAGQIVGWVYEPDNDDIDNYIDFGIYEINRETNRSFVNGYEPVILLDFNVDGPILEKI